jgi:hypothetical protein
MVHDFRQNQATSAYSSDFFIVRLMQNSCVFDPGTENPACP